MTGSKLDVLAVDIFRESYSTDNLYYYESRHVVESSERNRSLIIIQ